MSIQRTRHVRALEGPSRPIGALLASVALLACASGSSGGETAAQGASPPTTGGGAGVFSGGAEPPASTGTIAYVHGNELRLVEPDGSGDHLVWRTPIVPGINHRVTSPAWRPDGWEIAFSSDHELAYSVFDRDIYAVGPDGVGLRKLTNAPTRDQAASYPRGNVRVTVQNVGSSGSAVTLIVQGANPMGIVVPLGMQQTITVLDVADLGSGVQQGIVAAAGTYRWLGATVDVKAGQTVDAPGVLQIDATSTSEAFGASAPFWRSDSSKVGYVGPFCRLRQVAAAPSPGFVFQSLVDGDDFFDTCPAEWGPTAATASQLIATDGSDYSDTSTFHVVRMTEGVTSKPPPVLSLAPTLQIVDLHWLRDGSGFVFARRNSELEYDTNVWEYKFATATATQITNVQLDGVIRRFAMSPDGRKIAFEMVDRLYQDSPVIGYCDLWIMNRDGSGLKLLARDAGYPAWNPTR